MDLSGYLPVWDQLSGAQRERLLQHTARRSVRRGTVVHNGGEECTGLLMVESGQFRAYILSPEGREITLYRLFEGDLCLLSASCMMRSLQFDITVEAERDTSFLLIPAEAYKAVMEESSPLANFTNEVMAARFSEVMWLLEQVLWRRFDQRLAAFLLEESAIESSSCLKLTHEAIGSHLGSPREVVTRMLRYFQNEGMVKLSRGSVEITDEKRLRALEGS